MGQNITAFILEMGMRLHPCPGPPWYLVGRAASQPVWDCGRGNCTLCPGVGGISNFFHQVPGCAANNLQPAMLCQPLLLVPEGLRAAGSDSPLCFVKQLGLSTCVRQT